MKKENKQLEKKTATVSVWKNGAFIEGRELTEAQYNHEKQCQADDEDRHIGIMNAEKINIDLVNDFMESFDI
mgnify:FL=1|tara:strand:+ start:1695 stop:1910 length:216 start_codon:yes stop_codon:yes gene_type:complete